MTMCFWALTFQAMGILEVLRDGEGAMPLPKNVLIVVCDFRDRKRAFAFYLRPSHIRAEIYVS